MVEVERFLASHKATVHTVPDEFSTGGKFVRLGVSFTWNHAKREKIWTPKRWKLEHQNRGQIFSRKCVGHAELTTHVGDVVLVS